MNYSPQPDSVPPAHTNLRYKLQALGIAGGVVILDLVTKGLVDTWMVYGHSIPILGNFVRLTYIRNPDALFGISLGHNFPYSLMGLLATLVILIALAVEKETIPIRIYGLFLGGALGNLLDRFRDGQVTDFIDVGIGKYRWPVFNLADSAITIGLVLYVLYVVWKTVKEQREEPK